MKPVIIGMILGSVVGYGANYICKLTGGVCPLMNSKAVSITLWVCIGAMTGLLHKR